MTYFVNSDPTSGEKVQVFLDAIESTFGCSATIDAMGRLKMTDLVAGNSGMHVTSMINNGTIDPPGGDSNDPANPFGQTGINGDTILNITTPKTKILSTGQGLSAGGSTPVITPNTLWVNVYDDAGAAPVTTGTIFSFDGINGGGVSVSGSFTVVDNTIGTVQDFLDELEIVFGSDAEIDFAGRIVLTDRVADQASGYTSALEMTTFTSTGVNPWVFGGGPAPFLTLDSNISGVDGSLQGDVISSDFSPEALSTTQYANSSTTIFQDQNGFASGFLQSVSVDTMGVITGNYSNGQVLLKAQVALANFASLAGLFKEGGNIYRETTDSGAPVTGVPGTNGLGTIAPNALEQSNVDLGTEFVKLITVQRAFQANAKIITTTDEMLNDLINIKR
ncbi:MAG: flagellar hook-basal body complex protein [Deltaproteobacteria bacterium]|nr:flagellar hook-basal body complex protein [Deltaproteobacteria bacterium]